MLTQNYRLAIGSIGIEFVSRVLPVCFAVALLLFTVTDESFGQRNRQKKVRLAIGDIIEFDDFHDGMTYGLVVEFKPFLKAETIDNSGEIKEKTITGNSQYRIVDKAVKKKVSTVRVWKSSDGNFKIEASLAGVEDGKARLKKENGKIVSVPVKKLSEKDRDYLERKKGSDDPFAGEEEEDYPDEVYELIERRNELMADQELHMRLAKQNKNLMIGDIIKYEKFPSGVAFGIVKSLGVHGEVETVNEDGELEDDRVTSSRRWWFIDREVAPMVNRKWKSSDGKFKIEARLIEIEDGDKLVLEKPDGKTITVPLSKLGSSDETYVKRNRGRLSMAKRDPLAEARENYGPELQQLLARRVELVELVVDRNVAAKDVAKMKSIGLNTRPLKFTANQFRPLSLKNRSFSNSFSMNIPQHGRLERLSYSEQAGLVAFVVSSPFDGSPVLAVADIESGDVITNSDEAIVGDDAEVLSISPSGETILVYSDDNFLTKQLELWKHEDGQLTRINVVPYKTFWAPKAHLFSDTNGTILNDKGDLVFFDVDDRIKPTHLVPGGSQQRGNHVQISNDQKSLFYFGSAGSSLHVIDLETHKCIGGMSLGGRGVHSAFAQVSADGETATYIEQKQLTLFDLQSGDVIAQHDLPETVSNTSANRRGFPLISPTLIRTFSGRLYDLNLETEIGKIEGSAFGAQYFSNSTRIVGKIDSGSGGRGGFTGELVGGRKGGVGRGNSRKRTPKTVEVRYEKLDIDAINAFANGLTEDDIITFGRGNKVQLDLDLNNGRAEDDLDGLISDTMDDAGIKVVDRSDFVLEARYSEGKPQTQEFRIHEWGGTEVRRRTVTVTPKTCVARLKYRGEVIWSRGSSVSMGRPYSEEQLNETIKRGKSLSVRTLLDYDYPTDLRKLLPSKQKTFSWR